jgi:hypothetical protein
MAIALCVAASDVTSAIASTAARRVNLVKLERIMTALSVGYRAT